MIGPEFLNPLLQADLQASRQWTAGLLAAWESAGKLQLDAATELGRAMFAQWEVASADADKTNPTAFGTDLLSQGIARTTQIMSACLDTAVKLQAGLAAIAQSQVPETTQGLAGAWQAAWGGFFPLGAQANRTPRPRRSPASERRPSPN